VETDANVRLEPDRTAFPRIFYFLPPPASMASYNLVAPPSTESSMLDIPPQYLTGGGDGITTRPTSARTSYTRVERTTRPGSIADQESIQGDDEQGPQGDVEPEVPADPQASVTFLLVSGKRRTMTFQPELTVGRVKELVWNSWPTGEFNCSMVIVLPLMAF
jgi:hypothetical protein